MKVSIRCPRFVVPLLVATGLLTWGGTARSVELTWDAISGNSQVDDGGGFWDIGNVWTSDGGATNVPWPNSTAPADSVVFGGGAAGTAGGVGLNAALNVDSITFNAAPGGGAYAISGGALAMGDAVATTPTITANVAANISSPISSGYGLTKAGAGTLTVGATTITGATTVTGGVLQYSASGTTDSIVINGGNMLINDTVGVKRTSGNLSVTFNSSNNIDKVSGTGALWFAGNGAEMTINVDATKTATISANIGSSTAAGALRITTSASLTPVL